MFRFLVLLVFLLCIPNTYAEKRVKIGVIDTGLNRGNHYMDPYICDDGIHDITGFSTSDVIGHGDNVTSLIASKFHSDDACIVAVKFYHTASFNQDDNYLKALRFISKVDIKYLNLSLSGEKYMKEEIDLLEKMVRKGVKIIVAAGNNGWDLGVRCQAYPACAYNILARRLGHKVVDSHFFVVTTSDSPRSNYGGPAKHVDLGAHQAAFGTRPQTGTSQAAGNFTGRMIKREVGNGRSPYSDVNLHRIFRNWVFDRTKKIRNRIQGK